jgi:hypothetical protein
MRPTEDVSNPSYSQKRRCEVQSALTKAIAKVLLIWSGKNEFHLLVDFNFFIL